MGELDGRAGNGLVSEYTSQVGRLESADVKKRMLSVMGVMGCHGIRSRQANRGSHQISAARHARQRDRTVVLAREKVNEVMDHIN